MTHQMREQTSEATQYGRKAPGRPSHSPNVTSWLQWGTWTARRGLLGVSVREKVTKRTPTSCPNFSAQR